LHSAAGGISWMSAHLISFGIGQRLVLLAPSIPEKRPCFADAKTKLFRKPHQSSPSLYEHDESLLRDTESNQILSRRKIQACKEL
jgi:hypothetical protein